MAYLFDTDAVSEALRRRPAAAYVRWLKTLPRVEQFTSAVVIAELYKGAFRSRNPERHLHNIEAGVLEALTVLPYDIPVARTYGALQARLQSVRPRLLDADLQIAATAIHHDLLLVTGHLQHFERVPGLRIERALADARDPSRRLRRG